jgi:hypothetical protein
LGWNSASYYSRIFWDLAEECPGFWIIQREIKKAVSGQDFFINDERGKPKRLSGIDYQEFIYYYDLWDNFHYFGYPNSLDWTEAKTWFNTILKRFENAYNRTQDFIIAKANR